MRRWGLNKQQICAKISKHHDLQTNMTLIPSIVWKEIVLSSFYPNPLYSITTLQSSLYKMHRLCTLILYLQSFDSILGGEPDISASPQAKNVDFLAVHPQLSHVISWLSCLMQGFVITALLMSYASLCAVVSKASYAILRNVCILQIHFCKYV